MSLGWIPLLALWLSLRATGGDPSGFPRPQARTLTHPMMKKYRYMHGKAKSYGSKYESKSSKSGKVKSSKDHAMSKKKKFMMKGKGNDVPPPTLAPTPLSTIVLDDETFNTCVISMAVADVNRDDLMDPQEYVRFINRLNMETFVGETFEDLDPLLQENYDFLAGEQGIDIFGSKPGQVIPDDQPLRRICTYTLTLNEQVALSTPTSAPGAGSQVSFSECFLSLVISDLDRNDLLTQTEYVSFVNRYFDDSESFADFDDLPVVLQENFFQAAQNGSIDVSSAQPTSTPTDEILDFCITTQAAVDSVLDEASEN